MRGFRPLESQMWIFGLGSLVTAFHFLSDSLFLIFVVGNSAAGVSRSATVTIAYIMATQNLSFDDASNLVKSRRPIIKPNSGIFLHSFIFSQQNLQGTRAAAQDFVNSYKNLKSN